MVKKFMSLKLWHMQVRARRAGLHSTAVALQSIQNDLPNLKRFPNTFKNQIEGVKAIYEQEVRDARKLIDQTRVSNMITQQKDNVVLKIASSPERRVVPVKRKLAWTIPFTKKPYTYIFYGTVFFIAQLCSGKTSSEAWKPTLAVVAAFVAWDIMSEKLSKKDKKIEEEHTHSIIRYTKILDNAVRALNLQIDKISNVI
jgi:hypothetical protein